MMQETAIPHAGAINPGVSAAISIISYNANGEPLCYRCGCKLIDAELDTKRLDLGLHTYYCPHCDNKLCPECEHPLVYSSTLKGFVCLYEECFKYYFRRNEVINL